MTLSTMAIQIHGNIDGAYETTAWSEFCGEHRTDIEICSDCEISFPALTSYYLKGCSQNDTGREMP